MNNIKNCCGHLLIAIILFVSGYLLKIFFYQSGFSEGDFYRFENVLHVKEKKLSYYIKLIQPYVNEAGIDHDFYTDFKGLPDIFHEEGLAFLIYKNDSLNYWSTNMPSIPRDVEQFTGGAALHDLGNAYYSSKHVNTGSCIIVGLIKIKNQFSIENEFLDNRFQKDFQLDSYIRIIDKPCVNCFSIKDGEGNFLFALDPGQATNKSPVIMWIVILSYALCILFVLMFLKKIVKNFSSPLMKQIGIVFTIIFLVLWRWVMIDIGFFAFFRELLLFDPGIYASSDFLPSLGDLFINSIFIFFIFHLIYHEFQLLRPISGYKRKFSDIYIYLAFISLTIYHVFIVFLFRNLIVNSNISFEAHKILEINIFSFIGLLCIGLQFASLSLFADKIILLFRRKYNLKEMIIRFMIISTLMFIVIFLINKPDILSILFLYILFFLLLFYRYNKNQNYKYSRLIFLVVIFSVYSVYFILANSSIKERNNKKVLAINLASEHDPIAELLFSNLGKQLEDDERLATNLYNNFSIDEIFNYVTKRYFSGYFNKYDIQLTVCNPRDSVLIEPDDMVFHCYEFFEGLIIEKGIKIPGTRFYFLNDLNGRIGYFGVITYYNEDNFEEISMFIELQSKLITEELGYPELLLNYQQDKNRILQNYSYAKYHNDELIAQSGEYPYSLEITTNTDDKKEFIYHVYNGYNHLIYNLDNENKIIISSPTYSFFDIIISFSYIFLFFFILITIYVLLTNLPLLESSFVPTFRNRIQFTMISILLFSLFLIGGVTIYLSVNQYQNKHNEIIGEKIQSVYIELTHKLEFENELRPDWHSSSYESLDALLRKFSNVFYTDINLYDEDGNLLATSRPEIFRKKLIGSRMNTEAFYQMDLNKRSEFIHSERIGKLEYLSGYVPFMNNENELLAYLNLPYFTKQEVFKREVSTLIVAVLNIYVMIFLITISIAFLMSEKITRPLKLIQESFGKIKLGKSNEQIQYEGKDEIADLVSEYNRMVVELSNSVEKLARSERESAWREMAKQIAHEIKNPLTPMKLSVQHLQRAWKDKVINWDEYLEKFSKTMIDQINSLSTIATEFSNFAKMPQARNEVVNIITKVKNTVRLFNNLEGIKIKLDLDAYNEILVYADKEQLLRVFVNLVKNAVQSIPEDRKGIIEIIVRKNETGKKVLVKIKDNGKGIEEDMKDRLFQPNFTTKSSGMGLGLAIVKNVVENSGGEIWFETTRGEGSEFIVQLPVYEG